MSKKVALCLSGGVGLNHTATLNINQLYLSRKYIDYIKCYNSIKKYIVQPNSDKYEFHIFCHGWNMDLEEELTALYSPRSKLFEDNRVYNDEISKLCKEPGDFSGISKALSQKKSIEMKEAYEAENNIQYDIVIIYRYDVLLWKSIILDTYISLENTIYPTGGADGNSDFHFIMSNESSAKFKNLYDSISLGNRYVAHFWIKNYIIKYIKLKVVPDSILPGRHQEVMRKVHEFSINKGYLSVHDFNTLFTAI